MGGAGSIRQLKWSVRKSAASRQAASPFAFPTKKTLLAPGTYFPEIGSRSGCPSWPCSTPKLFVLDLICKRSEPIPFSSPSSSSLLPLETEVRLENNEERFS